MIIPNATDASMDADQYPLSTSEFLARYGDVELDLQNGTERIEEALESLDDEVFESADDARLAVYSGVSHQAIGRRFYSDRDPTPPGARDAPDQVSF